MNRNTPRNAQKNTPVPQAITRHGDPKLTNTKKWRVVESPDMGGRTSLDERIMEVPFGDDDASYGVRVHEMLHAKWSPTMDKFTPDGSAPDMYTLGAEDGRVETLATNAGLKRPDPLAGKTITDALIRKGNVGAAYAGAIASVGSPSEKKERRHLQKLAAEAEYSADANSVLAAMDHAAKVYAEDPSFNSTVKVADHIRTLVNSVDSNGNGPGQQGKGQHQQPGQGQSAQDQARQQRRQQQQPPPMHSNAVRTVKPRTTASQRKANAAAAQAASQRASAAQRQPRSDHSRATSSQAASHAASDGIMPVSPDQLGQGTPMSSSGWSAPKDYNGYAKTWADASVKYPPRPNRIVSPRGGRHSKATDSGVVPARMHRAAIDQKVFKGGRHRRQGTVLIDMSGSMALEPEWVESLMKEAPAAIIAGYNGDGYSGHIRIFAANGTAVSRWDMQSGGYNSIDGPAVNWLAHQRPPRIWITDGAYNGSEGNPVTGELNDAMKRVARNARIREINPDLMAWDEHGTPPWVCEVAKNLK